MWQKRSQHKCLFLHAAGSFHDVVWRPAADIYRTRTGWLAKFDLAGINPQEIELGVEGPCLTVRGMRRDCVLEEGCQYHTMEITYSRFERRLEFPVTLDRSTIETDYDAGMLLVRIQLEGKRP